LSQMIGRAAVGASNWDNGLSIACCDLHNAFLNKEDGLVKSLKIRFSVIAGKLVPVGFKPGAGIHLFHIVMGKESTRPTYIAC